MKSRSVSGNLILHLHPKRVNSASLRFSYTWGLGGGAITLFLLQLFTGFLLRFHYDPSPAGAYESIVQLQEQLVFGQFIRNIHHWAGMLLVVVVFFHMARVVFTSAYVKPRRANWLIGAFLLIFTFLFNFSGYLLPWDQRSFWAVTVGTNMLEYVPIIGFPLQNLIRGGPEVSGTTLLNFYSFHTGFLPVVLVILMVYHFWKIRKAGGLAISDSPEHKETTGTIPNLVLRELVMALVVIAVVFMVGELFDAPLLERANPAFSPNPAKAPWYFLGIQELMLHFHPSVSVILIPLFILAGFFSLPYLSAENDKPGVWFRGRRGKTIVVKTTIFTMAFIPMAILSGEYLIDFGNRMGGAPAILSEGLIPLVVMMIPVSSWFLYLARKQKADRMDIILAIFTFVTVSYILLMLTSTLFRGPGMELMWPLQH